MAISPNCSHSTAACCRRQVNLAPNSISESSVLFPYKARAEWEHLRLAARQGEDTRRLLTMLLRPSTQVLLGWERASVVHVALQDLRHQSRADVQCMHACTTKHSGPAGKSERLEGESRMTAEQKACKLMEHCMDMRRCLARSSAAPSASSHGLRHSTHFNCCSESRFASHTLMHSLCTCLRHVRQDTVASPLLSMSSKQIAQSPSGFVSSRPAAGSSVWPVAFLYSL
jgi:hypothetical protein